MRILSLVIVAALIGLALALAKLAGGTGSGGSPTGAITTTIATPATPSADVHGIAPARNFAALSAAATAAAGRPGRNARLELQRAGGS